MISEIKLDFDHKRLPLKRIAWVSRFIRLKPKVQQVSRTKKGWHALLQINSKEKLDPITLTLIQALMGSDYRRECFNALRSYGMNVSEKSELMQDNWNVLYKFKWQFKRKTGKLKLLSREKPDEKMKKKMQEEIDRVVNRN